MPWTSLLLSGRPPILIDFNSWHCGHEASWQGRWHFRDMSVKQKLPWSCESWISQLLSEWPPVLIDPNSRLHWQDRGHLDREVDILERGVLFKSCLYHGDRCPECHNYCRNDPLSSYMLPQDFVDSGHLDKEEDITWHEGLAKVVHTMELGILY